MPDHKKPPSKKASAKREPDTLVTEAEPPKVGNTKYGEAPETPNAIEPSEWEANEFAWTRLRADRFKRAWVLAALAVGARPFKDVSKRLKANGKHDEYRAYIAAKSALSNNLTSANDPGRLQYVSDAENDGRIGNLFDGLRRIRENPAANPNLAVIAYAESKGFLFDKEPDFLRATSRKRVLTVAQKVWKEKINRRILNGTVVKRRTIR
jgi:hypothetical protein